MHRACYVSGRKSLDLGREAMQKKSKSVEARVKQQYRTPKLTTHGTVAKLTQQPGKPKTHGRWALDSGISF
jgi:hypothetical protein